MFTLSVPQIEYLDPWDTSLEDRLSVLSRGEKRVAYFYETPDNTTFRYRAYNMIGTLRHSKENISATHFSARELIQLYEIVDSIDVLVLCRARYNHMVNRVITRARNKGIRVLYDIDDLVFDPDYLHLVANTLDHNVKDPSVWDTWYAYSGRIAAAMKMCDGVIVTNHFLAGRVRHCFEKPVAVIPNFLNDEQLSISRQIFEQKRDTEFRRTRDFWLGYFSGTPTHNKDFDLVSNALVRLLEADPRIRVMVVGFLDIRGALQNYKSRIEFHPIQDFIALQRLIGSVEVNLVPLQHNTFTNCKSEIKYFEAGIVGTVTVASPTFTLKNAIRDGENGYLANSFEWDEKLEYILQNMDRYPEVAERAYAHSESNYSWERQVSVIEAALFNGQMGSLRGR